MKANPNLAELSDNELVVHLQRVYRRTQKCNAELIRSLVAVNERRVHLKSAHPSLYEFCVKKLGMCSSSAHRYSVAARLGGQFPHLIERIEHGELHLSTLVQMQHHLTADNVDELLAVAHGRTRFEVKELLASIAPRPDAPSRMRKLPTPRDHQSVAAPIEEPLLPLAPERYRVQFNADRETYDDIVRARDLMRHSNPSGDLDKVMKFCARAGVDRLEARQRGMVRARGRRTTDRARAPSRHVPRAVRRAVFERDGAQCTFHDDGGHRCSATTLLELDHIDPFAVGGTHAAANLRVRCRPHNGYYAEQYYGKEFMEGHIRERRIKAKRAPSAANGADGTTQPAKLVSLPAVRVEAKGLTKAKEPRTPKARSSSNRTRTAS